MPESDLYPLLQLAATDVGARLFRNNVGTAWQGRIAKVGGVMIIEAPRPVHFGLAEGSGDLIGWRPVKIGPEHVGQTLAQFLSVEAKTKRGSASQAQRAWQALVTASGGVAMIVRSVEEFRGEA